MRELVLVILDRPGSATACLDAAEQVARLLANARIEVLHVRTDPVTTILPSEEVLTKERAAEISKKENDHAEAVREACSTWLSKSDGETRSEFVWTDVESTVEQEVRERGSEADLIVLPQPARSRDLQGRQILRTAVLETDRPILVIPRDGLTTFGQSIAIFWCDDRPTIKAVLNAMPLLATASHVYLLTVLHGANGASPHLPRLLASHDVEAEICVINRPAYRAGTVILDAAHEVGADLLVMGAYGRHPWAELVTGGVTRYMVTRSDLPLFICH